jgi:serine/threonine protein kinase/CHASE2 domain-containing sensor protein
VEGNSIAPISSLKSNLNMTFLCDTNIISDLARPSVSSWNNKGADTARQSQSIMIKLPFSARQIRFSLLGIGALATGATAIAAPPWLQALEYHLQSNLFETRGAVTAPDNILILAIDDDSLSQGVNYQSDPKQFADLAPIQSWPWRRQAYATVIDRLMKAGAKAIAIDVLFTTPSAYGPDDDQAFQKTLAQYPDRIVLASKYSNSENLQGQVLQYVEPLPQFLTGQKQAGFINLSLEADGKIHHLGERFSLAIEQQSQAPDFFATNPPRSFAAASLTAAMLTAGIGNTIKLDRKTLATQSIFYHGPDRTFPQIPFWSVLDSNHWQSSLANGQVFRDKIVIIGSTAPSQQDQQPAPFANSWRYPASMHGVEIQANAIASLQQQYNLQDLSPQPWLNGLWVVTIVTLGAGWSLSRKAPLQQILQLGISLAIAGGLSYGLLVGAQRIVPIAAPQLGILCIGASGILIELTQRQRQAQHLRESLKSHLSVPAVQAIVNDQESLRDLWSDRQQEVQGKRIGGRYEVVSLIGQGGFGETYLAQDLQRPGQPECVVKQLKLTLKATQSRTADNLQRLFKQEAQALEQLGHHDRIPQLLAYFEEMGEFYLVQELIGGLSLHHELAIIHQLEIGFVLHLLNDILEILEFVHSHHVIHRDIKPSNLMHRQNDGHWVLIDFGIAKKFNITHPSAQPTLAIGTLGYVAPEQALGHPTCASDFYALGITAIECLTGINATQLLELDPQERFQSAPLCSPELMNFLNQLTHPNERQRYASATLAIADLHHIPEMLEMVSPEQSLRSWNRRSSRTLNPDRDCAVNLDATAFLTSPSAIASARSNCDIPRVPVSTNDQTTSELN